MTTWAVIMAGGSGTRFWPMSRRLLPKQLLPLWGGRTLLELTAERLAPVAPLDHQIVVAGRHLAEPIRRTLPALPEANLLIEPSARSTLPCIGLAIAAIRGRDPDAVLGIFSADQFIEDRAAFEHACRVGIEAARDGHIATMGVEPTRPETGFGYIRYSAGEGDCRPVEAFVEKPDRATAEGYLDAGCYLWNAGIFFLTPATFDAELERQRPEFLGYLRVMEEAMGCGDREAMGAAFDQLEAISIDYGIMEGAKDVVVVPAELGWNDVGHWGALDEVLDADEAGNVVLGETLLRDTTECVVVSRGGPGKIVALIGMTGAVVVDTPDATLVMPKEMTQRVREIVAALKAMGRDDVV